MNICVILYIFVWIYEFLRVPTRVPTELCVFWRPNLASRMNYVYFGVPNYASRMASQITRPKIGVLIRVPNELFIKVQDLGVHLCTLMCTVCEYASQIARPNLWRPEWTMWILASQIARPNFQCVPNELCVNIVFFCVNMCENENIYVFMNFVFLAVLGVFYEFGSFLWILYVESIWFFSAWDWWNFVKSGENWWKS